MIGPRAAYPIGVHRTDPATAAVPRVEHGAGLATTMGAAILLVTFVTWAWMPETNLKYVLYGLPALLIAVNALTGLGQIIVVRTGLAAVAAYLVVAGLSIGLNGDLGFFAIRDVMIIAGYVLLFALPFRCVASLATAILVIVSVSLAIQIASEGVALQFNIMASQGIAESTFAFPIGALLIYFIYARRWAPALIAAVLLFVTFKRIAFAGIALVALIELVSLLPPLRVSRRAIAIVTVAALSCTALFLNDIFAAAVHILNIENANAVSISLGRSTWASALWDQIDGRPFLNQIFGFGPGAADETLMLTGSEYTNPHNDWLKILYDYGWFGLVAFHLILIAMFGATRTGIALYVYTATLFVTDNTLIYMHYFVCVAIVCAIASRSSAAPLPQARTWQ